MDKNEDNLVINQYEHGGSRIYFEDEEGKRDLVVDTFQDKEFAEWIIDCTKAYYRAERLGENLNIT